MFFIPFVGPLLGIVGVILAIVALLRIRAGRASGSGLAIGGLVTGVVGILVGIVLLVALKPYFDDLVACSRLPVAEQERCFQQVANNRGR